MTGATTEPAGGGAGAAEAGGGDPTAALLADREALGAALTAAAEAHAAHVDALEDRLATAAARGAAALARDLPCCVSQCSGTPPAVCHYIKSLHWSFYKPCMQSS